MRFKEVRAIRLGKCDLGFIFAWIIVFWLYLVRKASYGLLNAIFEKSIFADQTQIFNAKHPKHDVFD